ncbi:MAG: DUF2147 domain-containing protein [Nevskia sp.]|nr:DUF2147 domain-containing protein [Nevskia sp.]
MRLSPRPRLWPICLWWWAAAAFAGEPDPADALVGDWMVKTHDAVIRIQRQGDEYQGRLVWQLQDTFGPEDGPELNGKPTTDRNNPDPALRSRPMDGLLLLWGLHYDAQARKWRNGSIYDSDEGRVYHCYIWLHDPDHLRLHGYIGISLFGASTEWARVPSLPQTHGERTNSVQR